MVQGLAGIPGVTCWKPQGAYFVFPNIASFGLTSLEMASYLLEEANVATTPGSAFGALGEGHLRMLFASPTPEIEKGIERISQALGKLPRKG